VAQQLRQPGYVSYEEWRENASETAFSEWVDGEVVTFMPPAIRHQVLVSALVTLFSWYAANRGLGQVLPGPVELRLARSAREPDLVFVATANLHRLGELKIEGYADLVVEVISPDSTRRDRIEKLAEYAAAGIPEYWIFDPRPGRQDLLAHALGPTGVYVPIAPDDHGRIRSSVMPGFWFDPAWLRRDPLPAAPTLYAQIVENA
jgi:Uma2 family endonuclease